MGALRLMLVTYLFDWGSCLVSFSLKSQCLVVSNWFLLHAINLQQCYTHIWPNKMTENLSVFALPKYSSKGVSFRILGTATSWLLWSWKEFSQIHLAVTHIIPVGIALMLQINLLKVVKSTKKQTPLLSSHHFHVFSNNRSCPFSVMTFFQPRKLDIAFAFAQTEKCHKSKYPCFFIAKWCISFVELLENKCSQKYLLSSSHKLFHLWS